MTLVGWLTDEPGYVGGAELTQAEFRCAAPEDVLVVDCPPGEVVDGLDVYVCHNVTSYQPKELAFNSPVWWYHHDMAPHISGEQWERLGKARHICCSPLQRERMRLGAELVPPAVSLEPFREAAQNAGERAGAVAVGPFMNAAKAPRLAAEWARGNGGIDFIGGGPFAPWGSLEVSHDEMPGTLARFKTYVHLPVEVEPFSRSTVEAAAAGCEIVVNRLVGATYWLTEAPEKLETAAADFWRLVLGE